VHFRGLGKVRPKLEHLGCLPFVPSTLLLEALEHKTSHKHMMGCACLTLLASSKSKALASEIANKDHTKPRNDLIA